jgi:hypothetical protein
MPIKDSGDSKSESKAAEPGVLTEVAQKVGTAVGTVVSVLSGTSKSEINQSNTSKKGPQRTNSGKTSKMTASNNNRFAAKTSKRRSKKQPGSTGTELSPLKRHRIKSK